MENFEDTGKTQEILETWRLKGPDANLATQICNVLKEGRHFAELEKFLAELPKAIEYQTQEIIRSKIAIAWMKRNCELVYKLIKENSFSNSEDLIEIWDKAHYYEEEQNKGKALTPLARYRIRQRFMPPCSICPSGLRKKTTLPKEAVQVLKAWLDKNLKNPYPERRTKLALAHQSGLTKSQVNTWFANARRRIYASRPRRAAQSKTRGNASLAKPEAVTWKESSLTSRKIPLSPPSRPSIPPKDRSQQNTPPNIMLPPRPTRFPGDGLVYPLPNPQVYAVEPAHQLMNGAAFVDQPFFPFTLPEQFLLPHASPHSPIVNVCKRKDNRSCVGNRQQLQPRSHVTDPNVHEAHRSFHVTYPAAHVTYFSPRVPLQNSRVIPDHVFPSNGHAYGGFHAAKILMDMSNTYIHDVKQNSRF